MSVALSIAALAVSLGSALIAVRAVRAASRSADAASRSADAASRSADAASRSADAAESSDRRARTPRLAILLSDHVLAPNDKVIYRVRNDGPQDLDGVVVHPPRPPDRITYPIAITGAGWADDEIGLGPLAMTQETRFTLCCGTARDVPEFRVVIEC
jgi:hypothetical protein